MQPVSNPPNPWRSNHVELLGPQPVVETRVWLERARSALSRNDSPDVPFTWSVNPYRGCFHACAYCYARPTHQYLDWGAGTDFDSQLVVKENVPELLDKELARAAWAGEAIAFSGVTDPYQPIEACYGLTRRCLEVCLRRENPVGIITKGALIERDAELLAELHARAGVFVFVSVPFADDRDARAIEPHVGSPSRRFATIGRLARAGVPVGVAVAPVIPSLNDHQIPAILERAAAAGATAAFAILLRVPAEARVVWEERLRAAFPDRADKVMSRLAQMREGRVGEARFGRRMAGSGPQWSVIEQLFAGSCRRLGLRVGRDLRMPAARPPRRARQGLLFDRGEGRGSGEANAPKSRRPTE